jgi:hypothetical protein
MPYTVQLSESISPYFLHITFMLAFVISYIPE